ncbi:MAG: heme-binding domain-containing protein [Caldilineaceae bacterium]
MPSRSRARIWTLILWILLIANLSFLAIQLIPVEYSNPPVVREPHWDSPQTRAYAKRACFDCHSNETQWPWYAYLAPFSWRITGHVQAARAKFNISEWSPGDGDEAARLVAENKMPLWDYRLFHPAAQFSEADKQAFIAGLKATFGQATLPAQVSSVR